MSIAVTIPYYNGAKYIERALKSVEVQTLRSDEVIVVDDGSSKEQHDFLQSIKRNFDFDFEIVRKKNGGQGSARNMGVDLSKSDYICFLDQDDYFLPLHNEILMDAVPVSDPRFGWVYADLWEADEEGYVLRTDMIKHHSSHPKTSVIQMLSSDMFILPSASLVSRKAFLDVGGFDSTFTGYEDDDLFLRIFMHGWSNKFVDKSVTAWCINESSTSYSIKMSYSRMRYIKKLFKLFPSRPGMNRFFFRDLVVPRFSDIIISQAISSVLEAKENMVEYVKLLEEFRGLVAQAGLDQLCHTIDVHLGNLYAHSNLIANSGCRFGGNSYSFPDSEVPYSTKILGGRLVRVIDVARL